MPFFYDGVSLLGYSGTQFSATAQAGSSTPAIASGGILNGAGFDSAARALSPGLIASIFGTGLSTAPAAGTLLGLVPGTTALNVIAGGTRVTFDGVPAPLFFVSPGQLNVQVPFEVAGKTSVQVVVNVNGNNSAPVTVPVQAATPALFTRASNGKGAAVVLNLDGSLNGPNNPAAQGSIIQLYATGMGAVNPGALTGVLARSALPLSLSVTAPVVTIGGQNAAIEFSGLAPGFVGLWQINVRVPSGGSAGDLPLLLSSGGQNANAVTVSIR